MANKNAITVLWIENKNLKAPSFLPDLSERGVLLTKIRESSLEKMLKIVNMIIRISINNDWFFI